MIKNLFEQALGLGKPWYISSLEFDSGKGRLDIRIDFERGAKFDYVSPDGAVLSGLGVHDTREKRWRHLNFSSTSATSSAASPGSSFPTERLG